MSPDLESSNSLGKDRLHTVQLNEPPLFFRVLQLQRKKQHIHKQFWRFVYHNYLNHEKLQRITGWCEPPLNQPSFSRENWQFVAHKWSSGSAPPRSNTHHQILKASSLILVDWWWITTIQHSLGGTSYPGHLKNIIASQVGFAFPQGSGENSKTWLKPPTYRKPTKKSQEFTNHRFTRLTIPINSQQTINNNKKGLEVYVAPNSFWCGGPKNILFP